MNDQQLQLALAKMLPEEIEVREPYTRFYWKNWKDHCVRDTEWLHVCWLVEWQLKEPDKTKYLNHLFADLSEGYKEWNRVHASWQQRAEALCKVLGITTKSMP